MSNDDRLICVEGCIGLQLNEEYRMLHNDGRRIMVYNSNGEYKYYRRNRFVEKGDPR